MCAMVCSYLLRGRSYVCSLEHVLARADNIRRQASKEGPKRGEGEGEGEREREKSEKSRDVGAIISPGSGPYMTIQGSP